MDCPEGGWASTTGPTSHQRSGVAKACIADRGGPRAVGIKPGRIGGCETAWVNVAARAHRSVADRGGPGSPVRSRPALGYREADARIPAAAAEGYGCQTPFIRRAVPPRPRTRTDNGLGARKAGKPGAGGCKEHRPARPEGVRRRQRIAKRAPRVTRAPASGLPARKKASRNLVVVAEVSSCLPRGRRDSRWLCVRRANAGVA
jgi:hypothetical protein